MNNPQTMSKTELITYLSRKTEGAIDTTDMDLETMISIAMVLHDTDNETRQEAADEETARALEAADKEVDRRARGALSVTGASDVPSRAERGKSATPPPKSGDDVDEETARAIAAAMEDNDVWDRGRDKEKGAAKGAGTKASATPSETGALKGAEKDKPSMPPSAPNEMRPAAAASVTARLATPPLGGTGGGAARGSTPPPEDAEIQWQKELIDEFVQLCNCDRNVAKHMLGACAFDMSEAMVMFIEQPPAPAPKQGVASEAAAAARMRAPLSLDRPRGGDFDGYMDGFAFPPLPGPDQEGYEEYGKGDDSDSDGREPDVYDEVGIRRADSYKQQQMYHSPRHRNQDYEDESARTDAAGVTWMPGCLPPAHLSFVGDLQQAKTLAKADVKFLLCNIQSHHLFESNELNRDIWSNDVIQDVIHNSYVFWQRGSTSKHGKDYIKLYRLSENDKDAKVYPHIAVVDPRTGLILTSFAWNRSMDAMDVASRLTDFLENPKYENIRNAMQKNKEKNVSAPPSSEKAAPGGAEAEAGATAPRAGTPPLPTPSSAASSASAPAPALKQEKLDKPAAAVAVVAAAATTSAPAGASAGAVKAESAPAAAPASYGKPPAEPPAGGDSCRVQVTFLDTGVKTARRFKKTDKVLALYQWVQELQAGRADAGQPRAFELNTAFPAKVLDPAGASLAEENLGGAQVLVRFF